MVPEVPEIERPCARKGDKRKAIPSIVIQSSGAVSVKVEVDVVGLRSLTVLMDSVDVTQHWSERQTDRQRQRDRHRQTQTQRERQRQRRTERETETESQRQRETDRKTDRERQRQRQRGREKGDD